MYLSVLPCYTHVPRAFIPQLVHDPVPAIDAPHRVPSRQRVHPATLRAQILVLHLSRLGLGVRFGVVHKTSCVRESRNPTAL